MRDRLALEPRLCLAANRWGAHRATGAFFACISKLGDGWFWYALAALLALGGGTRGAHAALQMLATGLASWLLYRTLKRWTRRPRPYRSCDGVIAHVPPLDEFSFPSGHTLHAVSFSIIAIAWFPPLALPLCLFTALVAASRVVLGLHYPSDVLAAALLGGVLGGGSLWLFSGWLPIAS
ncbi:MAG: phosphatase PAP2 family protein [Proteobacteria bacterium]|nr:phosphatase PAP2 family protein [Pseudomonadota bacterium]